MKCPKCEYLGFETGDRCRNCGYEFSLMAAPPGEAHELGFRAPSDRALQSAWPEALDQALGRSWRLPAGPTADPLADVQVQTPDAAGAAVQAEGGGSPGASVGAAARRASPGRTPVLPLFATTDDDRPLVALPATPRPPLAVRRTPDAVRRRTPGRLSTRPKAPEPVLGFAEEPLAPPTAGAAPQPAAAPSGRMPGLQCRVPSPAESAGAAVAPSGAGRRLLAAAIDAAILGGIDLLVVYFTLRISALTLSDWRALPPIPLAAFLALLQYAYVSSFTALGGQTIGKMAAGISVVDDTGASLDPARAFRRTLAAMVSVLTLGAGFAPALLRSDRRAFHDRIAGTRVVTVAR